MIERPTSVVRELLDNSIDAGASEISVEVRGGGLELIRVADDGSGIPADQVELAFLRHATSKLRSVEELYGVQTLGFRGEALPSIAAVAEVSMVTRSEQSEAATVLTLRGGTMLRRGRAARRRGTSVTVRHLFHTVPARLKFLPAGRAESLLLGQLVRRYAMAHPEIRFSLALDGRVSFQSSGSGSLETVLAEVYGAPLARSLLFLRAESADGSAIQGFISGRSMTRPGRQHVNVIVNGRCATSRGVMASLEAAYRPLLPRGRHPVAAISIQVPAAELDPNVHPAKSEVRLVNEQPVADALAAAVRDVLGKTPARPADDAEFVLGGVQYRLPTPRRRLAESPGSAWSAPDSGAAPFAELQVVGQVHQTLILAEAPSGMFLVDQHRAHERVVYEALLARGGAGAEAQTLLEPLLLEVSPRQAPLLEERLPFLEELGFHCERFGGRDYLVRAIPSLPGGESLVEHLDSLLAEAASDDDQWRGRLLTALACRGALRRNRPLDSGSMRTLLEQLAVTAAPAVCPHGSPLMLHLSGGFLLRQFRW